MKLLLGVVVVLGTLGVLHCVPEDSPKAVSEDILKQLSLDGEKLVDEEVSRALYGVKEMREVMWRNGQKHLHLMTSLLRSRDKKKGAAQVAREVSEKLQQAEEQCKDSLQAEWEECRPCLEDACKSFYTSTCRRGFITFHAKVKNFFQRVSSRFGHPELPSDAADIQVNQDVNATDDELNNIHKSFTQLMTRLGGVVNRSTELVSGMRSKLDEALLRSFLSHTSLPEEEPTSDVFYPARDSGFLQGVGLEEVLDSFFDFGRSVVQEFSAVVTQSFEELHEAVEEVKEEGTLRQRLAGFLRDRKLCQTLRRQTSECWQLQSECESCQGALLTECPSVRELHVELDDASQLLDVSTEQYQEILAIVRRHVEETVSWLSNMAAEFGWVAQVARNHTAPASLFHVTTVVPKSQDGESVSEVEVGVNVLNSPPLTLTVPGELELQDPAFIQFVAQEALQHYKQLVRFEDE